MIVLINHVGTDGATLIGAAGTPAQALEKVARHLQARLEREGKIVIKAEMSAAELAECSRVCVAEYRRRQHEYILEVR